MQTVAFATVNKACLRSHPPSHPAQGSFPSALTHIFGKTWATLCLKWVHSIEWESSLDKKKWWLKMSWHFTSVLRSQVYVALSNRPMFQGAKQDPAFAVLRCRSRGGCGTTHYIKGQKPWHEPVKNGNQLLGLGICREQQGLWPGGECVAHLHSTPIFLPHRAGGSVLPHLPIHQVENLCYCCFWNHTCIK